MLVLGFLCFISLLVCNIDIKNVTHIFSMANRNYVSNCPCRTEGINKLKKCNNNSNTNTNANTWQLDEPRLKKIIIFRYVTILEIYSKNTLKCSKWVDYSVLREYFQIIFGRKTFEIDNEYQYFDDVFPPNFWYYLVFQYQLIIAFIYMNKKRQSRRF